MKIKMCELNKEKVNSRKNTSSYNKINYITLKNYKSTLIWYNFQLVSKVFKLKNLKISWFFINSFTYRLASRLKVLSSDSSAFCACAYQISSDFVQRFPSDDHLKLISGAKKPFRFSTHVVFPTLDHWNDNF